MNRLIPKIAAIVFACLLVLNLAAGATADVGPCLPHLCCGGPKDMGHHNGMINFAMPLQGCCEDCNDIFCDLLRDPLQDANAVNSSPILGHCHPVILATANCVGQSGLRACLSESRLALIDALAASQIPLYLEHLALII